MNTLITWVSAVLIAFGISALAGTSYHDTPDSQQDTPDTQAMARRNRAAAQLCGPDKTAVWEDEHTLVCLRNLATDTDTDSTGAAVAVHTVRP